MFSLRLVVSRRSASEDVDDVSLYALQACGHFQLFSIDLCVTCVCVCVPVYLHPLCVRVCLYPRAYVCLCDHSSPCLCVRACVCVFEVGTNL